MLTPHSNPLHWLGASAPQWLIDFVNEVNRWAIKSVVADPGGALSVGRLDTERNSFGRAWMHTIFRPYDQCARVKPSLDRGEAMTKWRPRLTSDYLQFLTLSNGAFLFGGNLILGGILSSTFEYASSANFEPTLLDDLNFGNPSSDPDDPIVIGVYPYSATHLLLREESVLVALGERRKTWPSFSSFLSDEISRLGASDVIRNPDRASPFFVQSAKRKNP